MKKFAKLSVFLCENRKNSLAAGVVDPRPPWPPAAEGFTPRPPIVAPPLPNPWCATHTACYLGVLFLC